MASKGGLEELPAHFRFRNMHAALELANPNERAPMIRALHERGRFTSAQQRSTSTQRAAAIAALEGERKKAAALEAKIARAKEAVREKRARDPNYRPRVPPVATAAINPMLPPEETIDPKAAAAALRRVGGGPADRVAPEVTWYRGRVAEKRIVLERAFQVLDPARSGFVEPAELRHALALYDVHLPSDTMFANLIAGIGRDAQGRVSWTHFLRAMCAALDPKEVVDAEVQVKAGQLRERLADADRSGRGTLGTQQMIAALRADNSATAGGLMMYLDKEEAKRVVETARMRGARAAAAADGAISSDQIDYGAFADSVSAGRSLPWFLLPKTHRSVTDLLMREEVSGEAFGDAKSHDELHRAATFVMPDGNVIERKGRVPPEVAHVQADHWPIQHAYPPGTPQRRSGTWRARVTSEPKPWSRHAREPVGSRAP